MTVAGETAALPSNGLPLARRQRAIVTPEGVPLVVELADRGSRAAAFVLDVVFIIIILVIGGIALAFTVSVIKIWALVIGVLAFFLLRIFYFPITELAWRGATPGKRLLGLRVIDRGGGPLRPESIVVRNLMREVEVFMPLTVLAVPSLTGFEAIEQLLMLGWVGIFTLMPLFNRDGLRVGDMVAGTLVITAPKAALLPDLTARAPSAIPLTQARVEASPFKFTPAQLGHYGVYELQTLEAVLRRAEAGSAAGREEIAKRIRAKIGWPDADQVAPATQRFDATGFLEAFYAAQRAHLERRLLFGHRRKDKHDRSGDQSGNGKNGPKLKAER
ncbi:RDD family protein [Dongia sp.]|uniref:RDD family protein n=1 Tax=Dongia sp. TaxID=1977262 RepID=UPI00375001F9